MVTDQIKAASTGVFSAVEMSKAAVSCCRALLPHTPLTKTKIVPNRSILAMIRNL